MTDTIISIAHIQAKARTNFANGYGIDDHGMNPGSAAIETWQDEWLRCAREVGNAMAAVSKLNRATP